MRRRVEEYIERYFETAEESERFRYVPDMVTAASAEKIKGIRATKFAECEKFVVYTPEELKALF